MSNIKKHTEETKKKISNSLMGRKTWNKGVPMSEETKKKISEKCKQLVISKETREKMKIAMKGKKKSEEHKKKISESHHDVSLENNPMWQGGKSYEKYNLQWTNKLREAIRERDNYTCKMCSKKQSERKFEVHHIDYNKKNCDPNNLITLCLSCHRKTNSHRDYWEGWFNENKSK